MNIHRATINDCHLETDTAIVIDVLRAFTTAAFAFSRGAREIALVSSVEDAFRLKALFPHAMLMGEDRGHPIQGFDFDNSPSRLLHHDLTGALLIQRTSAGTQGAVRSQARNILVTGFCTVSATLRFIRDIQPGSLTLVQTGVIRDGWGDEDVACADLIESRIRGWTIDLCELKERVRNSRDGKLFTTPDHIAFPAADLEASLDIDRFDFAMKVHNLDGVRFLRKAAQQVQDTGLPDLSTNA